MSTEFENIQVLALVQAMIGSVGPNFRRVTLDAKVAGVVRLFFLLEHEDRSDREEIDEISFEFEALQGRGISVEVSVICDSRRIEEIDLPGRVVFGRRECASDGDTKPL